MALAETALKARKLPLLLAAAGLAFGLPTASLAVANLGDGNPAASSLGFFTPAGADPVTARRLADQVADKGFRFTPAGSAGERDRTVTVAVRVDSDTAKAITVRSAIETAPGARKPLTAMAKSKYDLGIARGYQSFARPMAPIALPGSVRKLAMPDLSKFRPVESTAGDKPSRFQPRIALEDNEQTGRAEGTLEGLGAQTVDLGGAYRVTRNLDVTAGVRLSQERDRLDPLTDNVQDSQAVYVGTQFRF